MKNNPTHTIPTNLAAHIVITEEWMLTAPCNKAMQDNANINAGFRPTESSSDPNAGEITISVSAAHADMMDKVDVARSVPSLAMRAGAGENVTRAKDSTRKKDDD